MNSGGPADKAGVEPGDVIVEFNGKPVKNRDELVGMVTRTKPGTTVPLKVLRDKVEKRLDVTVDELNLEAETTRTAVDQTRNRTNRPAKGFGMTVTALTPDLARRLRAAGRHRRRRHQRHRSRQPGAAGGIDAAATCCCRSTAGR